MLRDFRQVDIDAERHRARVNLEDLQPCLGVRDADLDLAIEASRSSERRIQNFGNVRRAHDDDLPAGDEAVHKAQELRDHALLDFAWNLGTLRRHCIYFVDEENRRRAARRFLEYLAELALALAVELPHDLGAVEMDEMHAGFGGYGAGEQRLSGAWRAVQQHALGREDPQPFEDARVFERKLHDFADPRHLPLQSADVLIGHSRRAGGGLLTLDDANVSAAPDDNGTGWNRANHLEVHRLGKRRHADRAAGDNGHALQVLQHPFGRDDRGRRARPQR